MVLLENLYGSINHNQLKEVYQIINQNLFLTKPTKKKEGIIRGWIQTVQLFSVWFD